MQNNATLHIKPAICTNPIGPTTVIIIIIELNDDARAYSLRYFPVLSFGGRDRCTTCKMVKYNKSFVTARIRMLKMSTGSFLLLLHFAFNFTSLKLFYIL